MKRTKFLAFLLILFCGLFALVGCNEGGGGGGGGQGDEFKWEGREVADISVSEEQLAKDYDISEWNTVKETFMLTVEFTDGTIKDFPFTDSHFVFPDRDLDKLSKVNRVRLHVTVQIGDYESDEVQFYLNMVSFQAQLEQAIANAKDNMFICEKDGEYLVIRLKKTTTINGGQLNLTYDNSLTLTDPQNTLSDGNEDNWVSCQISEGKLSVFFAAADSIPADTVIAKVKYSGDYRGANIQFLETSHAAFYADENVTEISNNDITYYVSLK